MSDFDPNFSEKLVISVMSGKGGVGKSITSWNLGAFCHLMLKKNVLILDVEKGVSLSEVPYRGTKVEGKRLDLKHYFDSDALADDIEMFKMRYDVIILDTAGADTDLNSGIDADAQEAMNESAIACADFILCPIKPSVLDGRKTLKFAKTLKRWQKARKGAFDAMCYLNEADSRYNLTKEVHKQLNEESPIYYYNEFIPDTPYIGESMFAGLSIFEFKPNHPVTQKFVDLSQAVIERAVAFVQERDA